MENFHGKNPSNVYEKFHGISWKIPWNSMEFHETEVDGIPCNANSVNSWNFMKFGFDRAAHDADITSHP
jgi:hypothetical protein